MIYALLADRTNGKDNFGGWVTLYVCHPIVFHVVYSMANCYSVRDQLADQSVILTINQSINIRLIKAWQNASL